MSTVQFSAISKGPDAGIAYLEGVYADMATYPPKGLGQKFGFRLFEAQQGEAPHHAVQRILADPRSPVFRPGDPAGCIPLGDEEFLFFGRARPVSSAEDMLAQSRIRASRAHIASVGMTPKESVASLLKRAVQHCQP